MEQRGYFTKQLEDLKLSVLRMAAMSERAVQQAVQAFLSGNNEMAEAVIDNDVEINELECDIDKFNLELLALGQPMAKDLRFIVGSQRITVNLERIGDEAVNLAHRAVFLSTRQPMNINPKLEKLCTHAKLMVTDAISAFVNEDVSMANSICTRDQEADQLHVKILKDTINEMVGESRIVERGVHHIMAARHMERIADLATNVAEAVIFIVKGEDIKHHCRN